MAARSPGFIQGLTLISLAWVSTVAAVVIAPVLPQIRRTFDSNAHVDVKLALVATGPSLLVALTAVPFGIWADRMGRRHLLLVSLFLYGAAGMAPLWLANLDAIVVSRVALGLAESVIMTTGTALISDYFHGVRRQRWLAAQAGTAPLTAVFLAALGGLLGGFGWRTPFAVYGFGFALIPLACLFLWEPVRELPQPASPGLKRLRATSLLAWSGPLTVAAMVVLTTIMFMVTVVQFGFVVSERGMTLPRQIGLWSAFVTLGNPSGSLMYAVTNARTSSKMTIAYALFSVGFFIMSMGHTVDAAICGAFIANLGAGFYLPTAINWLLSTLAPALAGRGAGLWIAAVFLGQFLSPLVILALTGLSGSLDHAIMICAVTCTVAGLVSAGITRRTVDS